MGEGAINGHEHEGESTGVSQLHFYRANHRLLLERMMEPSKQNVLKVTRYQNT